MCVSKRRKEKTTKEKQNQVYGNMKDVDMRPSPLYVLHQSIQKNVKKCQKIHKWEIRKSITDLTMSNGSRY